MVQVFIPKGYEDICLRLIASFEVALSRFSGRITTRRVSEGPPVALIANVFHRLRVGLG
jgi:hypothetical protein